MQENKYCRLANVIDGMPIDSDNGRAFDDSYVKVIRELITERQAEICAHCPKYYVTAEDIAKNMSVEVSEIIEDIEHCVRRGVLYVVTRDGIDMYRLANWAPGIMEHCLTTPDDDFDIKVVAEAFVAQGGMETLQFMAAVPPGLGTLRAIPVNQAIKAEPNVVSHEQIETYLNQSDSFSVADCACRKAKTILGDPCEHPYKDTCVQIGEEADFYVRTGRARRISREEAREILDRAERLGLVHEIFNNEGENQSTFICNCCSCSCGVLSREKRFKATDYTRSNFVSEVNPENCVACGACTEICPMDAIKLGTSFCAKEEQIPDMTLNHSNTIFGEDYVDQNYNVKKMVAPKGTSPCKTTCPAHISVQGYIRKAAEGKYSEALKVIKRENPFPAVCGRICPHNCENECSRARVDEAMAIDDIKKFIADKELHAEHRYIPEVYEHYEEKVAVIGAGPAGLTAAYYLAAQGYPVTVFERNAAPGGMLKFGIPSFRLEKDVIDAEIDVLRELGVEFKCGVNVGQDISLDALRADGYKAFYVAVGAQNSRKLGIEGEDLEGVVGGIGFLREVNLGNLNHIEGDTVVVGGGNVALDVARAAIRIGNRNVKMFCLEKDEEMPTVPEEKAEAVEEGVAISNSWGPKRILGENGKVTGVEFMRCVSVFNEDGRFSPVYDENDTIIVPCTNVYTAIGQSITWGNLFEGSAASATEGRSVKVAEITYQTEQKDVFAGGDCAMGPGLAINAIATGKSGAISIHRFLRGYGLTKKREREYFAFDKESGDYSSYDRMPRQRPYHAPAKAAIETMSDTRATLTEEQLQKEAKRCLGCGVSVVDPYMCIGCGLCFTKCEYDAIRLKKVTDIHPGKDPQDWFTRMMAGVEERNAHRGGSASEDSVRKNAANAIL
ncbi:MAG: FAD-dependent oxidoreductase [Lachnospiraceae bacterium]|nr:FAD-dependent oxidoreductase [Lachnospiraceae bacterium]